MMRTPCCVVLVLGVCRGAPNSPSVHQLNNGVVDISTMAEALSNLMHVTLGTAGDGRGMWISSVCIPATESYTRLCAISTPNHARYALAHGYTYALVSEPPTLTSTIDGFSDSVFLKVALCYAVLSREDAHLVFWMDADSVFMNFDVPLIGVLGNTKKDAQLALSGEIRYMQNAGHFLLRRGEWATQLLESWWAVQPPPEPVEDQAALSYVLSGQNSLCRDSVLDADGVNIRPECNLLADEFNSTVELLPQRLMNAYIFSQPPVFCNNAVPGLAWNDTAGFRDDDLLIHLARPCMQMLLCNYIDSDAATMDSMVVAAREDMLRAYDERVINATSTEARNEQQRALAQFTAGVLNGTWLDTFIASVSAQTHRMHRQMT